MNKVYLIRNYDNGRFYEAGKVYEFEAQQVEELVTKGYAVKADYPTLDNYELQIKRAVETYKTHAAHIEKNAVMSAHERQYSILKAREALDETVAKLKADYQTELRALTIVAAQSAFKKETATPEAQAFVDGVLIQLRTDDPEEVAELIRVQLPLLDGPTKTELLRRYDEVKALAGSKAHLFDQMATEFKTGQAALERKILSTISDYGNPTVAYDILKSNHRTYQPGYLAQEVSAQYRSDREYEAALAEIKGGESQ